LVDEKVSKNATLPLVTKCSLVPFYRRKTDLWQTHRLSDTTLAALRVYLEETGLTAGRLLRGSYRDGSLNLPTAMSRQAINRRVQLLGESHGFARLSPHDCRHHWATSATKGGTDIAALQDAGGWASPVMPMRYVEASAIANERVTLWRRETEEEESE
jgi:integrase